MSPELTSVLLVLACFFLWRLDVFNRDVLKKINVEVKRVVGSH